MGPLASDIESRPAFLSPRRREVLELISNGLTNAEIAGVLHISVGTARTHVAALLEALDVSNRTEAATAWLVWKSRTDQVARVIERPAIAVVPFAGLGPDGASEVASAVSHDLAALFARWILFPVIAWSSSTAPRAPGQSLAEFGRGLGARYLVHGAVRAGRRAWRLTVGLDDLEDDRCLWADSFDFPRDALFDVQDEVTAHIVATAYGVLTKTLAVRGLVTRHPEGLDAWGLAHEGLRFQAARDRASNEQAKDRFRAALDCDGNLVLAHYGQGLCLYDDVLNQWGDAGAGDQLHALAQTCIELAPHAAEGYFLLGRSHQTRGQHAEAVHPLEVAVARNPSLAPAQALLAQVLVLAGRPDEGLVRMKHAMRLAPRSFVAGLASFHYLCGDNQAALAAADSALATNPDYPFGLLMAAVSAWGLGARASARAHAENLRRSQPDFSPKRFASSFGGGFEAIERIARALAALGLDDRAPAVATRTRRRAPRRPS